VVESDRQVWQRQLQIVWLPADISLDSLRSADGAIACSTCNLGGILRFKHELHCITTCFADNIPYVN
jgi:hypothetical protein